MDPGTVLLTANTETVYAITHLDLKTDGPTVVEATPKMLGMIQDGLMRSVVDIGPLGPDKGQGGKISLPPFVDIQTFRPLGVWHRMAPVLPDCACGVW